MHSACVAEAVRSHHSHHSCTCIVSALAACHEDAADLHRNNCFVHDYAQLKTLNGAL